MSFPKVNSWRVHGGGGVAHGPLHSRQLAWHLAQLHQSTEDTHLKKEKKEKDEKEFHCLLENQNPRYAPTRQKEG